MCSVFLDTGEFKPRLYQELITATAIKKNTLCILPTGLGKTYVALMVAADRLEKFPKSKILMVAPTRPLVSQHLKTFKKYLIAGDVLISLTGKTHAEDRAVLYKKNQIFFTTPQIIKNDVESGILDLSDFSLLIIDECHRSVKNYSYTFVVDYYVKHSRNPLILGLTASPGGIKDKIEEVKKNLHVTAVEIRSEKDADVQPYVQKTETEKVMIELPEKFKEIKKSLEGLYKNRIYNLLRVKAIHSPKISKRDLIATQTELGKMYSQKKDFMVARAMVDCAQAIKIDHALELLETQGIMSLNQYLTKMKKEKTTSSRKLLASPGFSKVIKNVNDLYVAGVDHPKMKKMIQILKKQLKKKKNSKIIVFANYRDTVGKITKLVDLEEIEVREFIGQAIKRGKGLSQKEQIEILNEFKLELFNVLVSTSIGEEGLDIPELDMVIFYDSVPSEIRKIQRSGRTGRTKPGKVIFLIAKDTRDEWYYWSAHHKEKRMKKILKDIKENENQNKSKKISDYVK
jgi:ERCC4-related helicase